MFAAVSDTCVNSQHRLEPVPPSLFSVCVLATLTFEASPRHTCQVCVSTDTQKAAALLTHREDESNHSCSTSGTTKLHPVKFKTEEYCTAALCTCYNTVRPLHLNL